MQEFPPGSRSCPGPEAHPQQDSPGPRTRAQQAAGSALAAADVAIGIGDVAIGIGGGAFGLARSVFRLGQPLLGSVMSPLTSAVRTAAPHADRIARALPQPWLPPSPQPWLRQVAARGRQDRETLMSGAAGLFLARVPGLTNAVLDQLDLTAVVAERVNVNALAARIDVDAVARRVDLIAMLDQLDSTALTRYLLEELDLPAIIQASTGSIMSDAVHDVRMLSINADERLSRAVDAMLLRRSPRRRTAPGTATT